MTLGDIIRHHRQLQGLSQPELDIAKLCEQLDTQRADPKVLHIESIRTYLTQFERGHQRRSAVLMALFTLAIGIGVALFYAGHSKAFFPGALYSYVSQGEIKPDEPLDYFIDGWRRPFGYESPFEPNPELKQAQIDQANRVDPHTIQSFQPLENEFVRHLDNGNRRAYRVQGSPTQVSRPQNAWMMFIGIAVAVSAMIALMILLRLGPARRLGERKR